MFDDCQLICFPPAEVHKIWPGKVCDLIDSGYAASDVPMPENLLADLIMGHKLLWLVVTSKGEILAAMLTSLFQMRSGKMCKMMECGGDRLAAWRHFHEKIENYARDEGCDRVMVEGRPGWARILTGYTVTAVVLEKRL